MRRTIIVTGASRGIGRAIALSLANEETSLLISCSKSAAKLNEVKALIEEKGARCETYIGDMGNYSDAMKMFDLAFQSFGHVDILINNAGISMVGLFQDMTADEWNKICSTNIDSVFNCCHFAVKDMLGRHCGKIINISSVWGLYGASCEVAYSATKGAVNAFTRALAKELAPSSIQVNAIACGAINTDMNSHLDESEKNALEEEIPAGRFGDPQEVAQLVESLVNMNSYLTGQIITLDGGWI
ncbi:MAG: SDR family NAD(P)-dependent oxidoreductase [Lachnospira sp.]|nr:SDR family NAD(P)-dependent oxidoreductase [Lachnospira sp.]